MHIIVKMSTLQFNDTSLVAGEGINLSGITFIPTSLPVAAAVSQSPVNSYLIVQSNSTTLPTSAYNPDLFQQINDNPLYAAGSTIALLLIALLIMLCLYRPIQRYLRIWKLQREYAHGFDRVDYDVEGDIKLSELSPRGNEDILPSDENPMRPSSGSVVRASYGTVLFSGSYPTQLLYYPKSAKSRP